jgi:hypothetical protein
MSNKKHVSETKKKNCNRQKEKTRSKERGVIRDKYKDMFEHPKWFE